MNMYQLNQHPLLLKTLCSFFDNFDRGDKLTMSSLQLVITSPGLH